MVTIYDPITVNDERIQVLQTVIDLALKETNYFLATRSGRRCEGNPYSDLGNKHRTELEFGLLTALPEDTRKYFLGMTLQSRRLGQFVGTVRVKFDGYTSEIKSINIEVYGLDHKPSLTKLAEALESDLKVASICVIVEFREPFEESTF